MQAKVMKRRNLLTVLAMGAALGVTWQLKAGWADHQGIAGKLMEPSVFSPSGLRWQSGPASLPAGAMIAILEGDPAKEGPFAFRVKVPDGYRIPPHTHPKTERVTVVAGTFRLGMGEKFDAKALRSLPAGTYGHWPAGMKHFVQAQGETIVQFHGIGPWRIDYLDPADDPRRVGR